MEISELSRPFIIIYKELKFFFHTYGYKSLIWALLHTPKIDKTMSRLLYNSVCYGFAENLKISR